MLDQLIYRSSYGLDLVPFANTPSIDVGKQNHYPGGTRLHRVARVQEGWHGW
ncbi:hypothetical protein AB7M49_004085 [Bradyrhizobium elkanii]